MRPGDTQLMESDSESLSSAFDSCCWATSDGDLSVVGTDGDIGDKMGVDIAFGIDVRVL